MAIDWIGLLLAGAAGALLGLFYFGGLWLTVRRLPVSGHPVLWTLGSLLVRTGLTLAGFYLAAGGRWDRLLAALAGFVAARTVLVRRLGPH